MDTTKILVIDDDEMNREMLKLILCKHFDEILCAENGCRGLDILAEHHDIDLILLDLEMPVMDGRELLAIVKNSPQFKSIPVIVAAGNRTDALMTLGQGADDFITKPYDPLELYLRVNSHIQKKRDKLKLETALLEAEEATRSKSVFLATMSHEIRNPMNGVIAMAELLLDTNLSQHQRQLAEIINKSGESLLALLNDILDFSKIEAGKFEIATTDFDFRTMVEDTAEMLAMRAVRSGLEMICRIDSAIPQHLKGDPCRLRQIIANLAGNAIKFTPQGEIIMSATLDHEDTNSVVIRFSVHDTGIGIQPSRQSAIFSPYVQADDSTTRRYGGTGLGLTICKQLTELMGGEIGVESEENQGSTFWFTVRLEKQSPDVLHRQDSLWPIDISRRKILVVDDNATNRMHVAAMLGHAGCCCETASDGTAALQWLRRAAAQSEPFHLVLLDQTMPDMDCLEIGKLIKADPSLQSPGIIIMTVLGHQHSDGTLADKTDFDGYIPKPVRQRHLYQCIAHAFAEKADNMPVDNAFTLRTEAESSNQNARILIAEDDVINQRVVQAIFGKLGYQPDIVENGIEAVQALQQTAYDIVFMDWHMPKMSGFEATAAIRSQDSNVICRNVPIVAMTANATQQDCDKCLEAGMNDYLAKPIKKDLLQGILKKYL